MMTTIRDVAKSAGVSPITVSRVVNLQTRGVEDAAQNDGYYVLLCNTDENSDKFTKYINTSVWQILKTRLCMASI